MLCTTCGGNEGYCDCGKMTFHVGEKVKFTQEGREYHNVLCGTNEVFTILEVKNHGDSYSTRFQEDGGDAMQIRIDKVTNRFLWVQEWCDFRYLFKKVP
jgi:hypothetical protein